MSHLVVHLVLALHLLVEKGLDVLLPARTIGSSSGGGGGGGEAAESGCLSAPVAVR